MNSRRKLYEIRTVDGQLVTDGVPLQEVSLLTGKTVGAIYGAMQAGRVLDKKYVVEPVDEILSRKLDRELLIEFDVTRKKLLEDAKRRN